MMTIKELLTYKDSKIHHTTRDTRLATAIDSLNYYNIGALLVMDGKKLRGIVTERDILHALSRYQQKFFDLKVADIMTTDVIHCQADDSIQKVLTIMNVRRIRHLPVMESDILLGIVSIKDLINAML
ncbi:MAG: CBS domain-containing protein, partial [Calditrichaeota bacterium]|nr:CBS domain-containing protein [Calditrichota bacterium]